ncbi:MAG: DNA primase [Rhodospirillaceae bacterium]|nr:DNA primase [Rhodospirillaceae bacterium]
MAITPQFLDELRSRVPVSDVVGKRVKLAKKGREFSGLCPFHSEKTPSFTVNDDKAFYHCFGCGAHGDVIRFVTETEGLTFPEAVGKLAGMAGMEVPKATPEERQRAERAKSLQDACEAALRFFRRRLNEPAGADALAYLRQRGVKPETIEAFRLGWAPDGRVALKQALTGEGFPETMLVEAGLLVKPEDGGDSYDRFRGRVIFPIADRRGRVIAFGGRALGDVQPKYLNSPETPLFNKGRLLYALDKARQAVRDGPDGKGAEVIVTEGYTDVIALHQAGFGGAVAPLGTALTESQIEELWRLAPGPVLCFDGDEAGRRAAGRALDRLLPRLVPGKTARFVFLPEGEDPDSFVSLSGPEAFGRLVERAMSVSEALWRRVAGTQTIDSPEFALIVEKKIEDIVAQMAERRTQFYYRVYLKMRLFSVLWNKRDRTGKAKIIEMKSDAVPEENVSNAQKALVAALLNHPRLIREYGERLVEVNFVSSELERLLMDAILLHSHAEDIEPDVLKDLLRARDHEKTIANICNQKIYAVAPFADPACDPDMLEIAWKDALRRQNLISAAEELQQRLKRGLYREDDAEFARLTEFASDIARQAAAPEETEPG